MTTSAETPTLSELRNSLAQIHTAPLRVIPAERYERDLGAALGMLDRLTGELAPLSGRGVSRSGRYGSAVKTRWSGRSPSTAVAR